MSEFDVVTNNYPRPAANMKPQRQRRSIDVPSPTVTSSTRVWQLAPMVAEWVDNQAPATTAQGDPRIAPRGHHDRQMNGATRVTVEQAGVLQSFRPDYPWRGKKGSQYQQVGNAVPPLLAAAVIGNLLDLPNWREVCMSMRPEVESEAA